MGRLKYTPDSKEDFARMRFVYGVHGEIEHQKRKKRAWKRYWKRGHSGDRVGKFNKDENPRFTSTVDIVTKVNGKEQKVRLENGYNYKQAPKIGVAHARSAVFGNDANPGASHPVDKYTADIAGFLSQQTYNIMLRRLTGWKSLQMLANKAAANGVFYNYSGALRTSYAAAVIGKNSQTGKYSVLNYAFNKPKGVKTPPGTWVQKYSTRTQQFKHAGEKRIRFKKKRVAYRQGFYESGYSTVTYRLKDGSSKTRRYKRKKKRTFVHRLERMEGYRSLKDIKVTKLSFPHKRANGLTVIIQNTAPYSALVQNLPGKNVLDAQTQDGLRRVTEEVSEKTLNTVLRRVRNRESYERKEIEAVMAKVTEYHLAKVARQKDRKRIYNARYRIKNYQLDAEKAWKIIRNEK